MSREQWGHGYYNGLKAGLRARMSFKEYVIAMYDGKDSLEGDFAYDMSRDKDFPEKARFHDRNLADTIYHHLCKCGACSAAIETFFKLYREWWRLTK